MRQTIQLLSLDSLLFPPLEHALADPNGLIAYGGDLTVQRLKAAYTAGIFPWFNQNDPIMWWSPDPRAIIYTDQLKINRTLRKVLAQQKFTVTLNQAFDQVIQYCAKAPFRKEDTWIIAKMQLAYQRLHQHGLAHSIEVWLDNELVGGLYGVAINGFFSGESMFYKKSNASKIALVYLSSLLKNKGVQIIDCQLLNPFLADMGAIEISRTDFIKVKQTAINTIIPNNFWAAAQLHLPDTN